MSSQKKDKSKGNGEKWLLWHKEGAYVPKIFDDIGDIREELLRDFKDYTYDEWDIDEFVVSKLVGEHPIKFSISVDVEE